MIHKNAKSTRRRMQVRAGEAFVLTILSLSLAGTVRADRKDNTPRVIKGDFGSALVLTGSLQALTSEEFKVPITDNWRIQIKWMVKEGDSVKPGDPVVRFDTAMLASSIETARDTLKTKREEKAQKEADYKHQKFELEVEVKKAENDTRQKEIDASIPEGIESKYEYDRKQLEKKKSDYALENARTDQLVKLAETEIQIKILEIEIQELEAQLAKLRSNLNDLTLTARTAGAVIYGVDDWSGRKVQVGDTVFATRKVAEIPDLSSLQVQAWISETHIKQVRVGQKADLFLDAYPEIQSRGVIKEVSKNAEAVRRWGKSHYFRVDIEMDKLNPDIMKPGMSVRCEVSGPQFKDVLLIPLEMTSFDGHSFWIEPEGGRALKLSALGFNEFQVAVGAEANPGVKAEMALRPVGVLKSEEEEKRR